MRDSGGDIKERNHQEGVRILASLKQSDLPIALDAAGAAFTSREFAQFLAACDLSLRKRPAFIIGGPYGLAPEVLAACAQRISLSAMTFPHELARVLLLEQIYRAETILRNFPYHH